jgi:hypothetical protein
MRRLAHWSLMVVALLVTSMGLVGFAFILAKAVFIWAAK